MAKDLTHVDDDQLPVVARLVVEVRSDGTRTIARGVIEDHKTGQRTSIRAGAESELALLGMLMKAASGLTRLARRTARALTPSRDP
jgi:hypothetical protein